MAERLTGFNAEEKMVSIYGIKHPIELGTEPQYSNSEFDYVPYTFLDKLNQVADGVLFHIKPRGATQAMLLVDDNIQCDRLAIKGRGWFVGRSPTGEIVTQEVGPHLGVENPVIGLKKGWVDCFIASEEGLEVADLSTPPFKPEMEVELKKFAGKPEWENFSEFRHSYDMHRYEDREMDFAWQDFHDVWDIEDWPPHKQRTLISQRLRDEEVRYYFPKMYYKFVIKGPTDPENGPYKPAEMNELDYLDWTYEHEKLAGMKPSAKRPLSDFYNRIQKANEIVASDEPITEERFRKLIAHHMEELIAYNEAANSAKKKAKKRS